MPRPRSWTDEQLTAAVAESRNLREVHIRLGIRPDKYDVLREHIRRLGLDASHLARAGAGSPRTSRRFRDEDLIEAVKLEWTVHGVLRRLGYSPSGGMFRFVVAHIRRLDLDTSHFRGQGWARGLRRPSTRVTPLEKLLVKGSTTTSSTLRKRLIAAGIKPARCVECGLSEWRGVRSRSAWITSTVTTLTTDWRTSVSCVRTVTPSPTPGVGGRSSRRSPTGRRHGY